MRFGPNESSIDQPDLFQALELSQTYRQQFSALQFSQQPRIRRTEVAVAIPAKIDGRLLWDRFCNVDGISQTRYTETSVVCPGRSAV